jgi:hypothetical protein
MTSPSRRSAASPARTSTRPSSARTHRTGVVRIGNLRSTPTRPHLWVVPDGEAPRRPRPAGRRRTPWVLLVVGLLLGTTLGLLFLNTAIAVNSLDATHLRTENAQRAQDVQRLERQVVEGGTPEERAKRAAAAGMVPAGSPGYLAIDPDGDSAVRGTATPAPHAAPAPAPATTAAPATSSPARPSSAASSSAVATGTTTPPVGTVPDAGGD